MMIYCRIADGAVVDRAVFDAPMPDDWPDRAAWVAEDEAQIGWSHDGETFTPPPREPDQEPEPDPRDAEIADLKAAVAALKKAGVLTDEMIDAERVVKDGATLAVKR